MHNARLEGSALKLWRRPGPQVLLGSISVQRCGLPWLTVNNSSRCDSSSSSSSSNCHCHCVGTASSSSGYSTCGSDGSNWACACHAGWAAVLLLWRQQLLEPSRQTVAVAVAVAQGMQLLLLLHE